MCFSATASFAASGILAAAGTASMIKAKKKERFLAAIPLLFALQQLFEGFQWISIHPSPWSTFFGYAFLFFAFLVWPTYIPLASYMLETSAAHRRWIRWFVATGVAITIGMFYVLLTHPLTISFKDRTVCYDVNTPISIASALFYVAVVCGSMAISSHKFFKKFGYVSAAFALLSLYFYTETFTSVWCFSAAILSGFVCLHFYKRAAR